MVIEMTTTAREVKIWESCKELAKELDLVISTTGETFYVEPKRGEDKTLLLSEVYSTDDLLRLQAYLSGFWAALKTVKKRK